MDMQQLHVNSCLIRFTSNVVFIAVICDMVKEVKTAATECVEMDLVSILREVIKDVVS